MSITRVYRSQIVPLDIPSAWDFFSSPKNLALITPPKMGFTIRNESDLKPTYAGQLIVYRVKPLWGIPMMWITEIFQVNEPYGFIDKQLVGPYKLWHHEHHFAKHPKGVLVEDVIYYIPKGGPIGGLMNRLFIKKQLEKIMDFREAKLLELFGPP